MITLLERSEYFFQDVGVFGILTVGKPDVKKLKAFSIYDFVQRVY
jgi:hypothetical protein